VTRIRLLYVVGQLGTGGLERQLFYLLKTMDLEHFHPAVAVWNFDERENYVPRIRALGVPLYSLPSARNPFVKLNALKALAVKLKPELLHSYSFYTNFATAAAARVSGSKAVGSIRSDFALDKRAAGPVKGELCARWPRYQICNSRTALRIAAARRRFFVPLRMIFVGNALDLETFHQVPPPNNGCAQIAGVGSLLPIKRWDRLIIAAADLKARGLNFRVKIAGDGPLRLKLEEMTKELAVADCVEFRGYVADVKGLLSESDMLVHTSDAEGTPNAIMEAMACARPVVTTDVGDAGSLVCNGRSGYVVDREDQVALNDRIDRLIGSPHLRCEMGRMGREKAETDFALSRLVDETFNAYRQAGWSAQ
jgi:glycosyltransferase involved in cell wall biosynthesis